MKHLADIQKSAFGLRKNKNYNADLPAIRGERENNMRFTKYNNPSRGGSTAEREDIMNENARERGDEDDASN